MAEQLPSQEVSEDDASELAAEHLARGVRLGRYELLVPVAKGGMARVWAARQHGQRGFTKLVAIKTILPHLARDTEFERMFLDEARIASQVHHPNVCEIYELGEEGAVLYLAMEWVNGESLARVLRAGSAPTPGGGGAGRVVEPLDPRVAARIVAEACGGLAAAHALTDDDGRSLEVVHRDVSPHNVLIGADGCVKVVDFGVVKALDQVHSATSAGQLKGKVNYMPPEQITGAPVDRRSDLFALGCVLYEATTGTQPFRADGDHQVMNRVVKGDYVRPGARVAGYPGALEAIVVRALAARPEDRFQDAEAMRTALEEWIAQAGPVLLPSHVAAAVRTRAGAAIDKRREKIRRAWARKSDRIEVISDAPPAFEPTPSATSGVKRSPPTPVPPPPPLPRIQAPAAVPRPTPRARPTPLPTAPASLGGATATDAPTTERVVGVPSSGAGRPGAAGDGASTAEAAPTAPAASAVVPVITADVLAALPNLDVSPSSAAAIDDDPDPTIVIDDPLPTMELEGDTATAAPVAMLATRRTPPPLPPGSSLPPPSVRDLMPASGRGVVAHYALAAAIGIGAAAVLGAIGLVVLRVHGVAGVSAAGAPAVTAPAAPTATGPGNGAGNGAGNGNANAPVNDNGGASSNAGAGQGSVGVVSENVAFRVMPVTAVLVVDGEERPASVRSLPRPAPGKTLDVVVRANGYEPEHLRIDATVPASVDVILARPQAAPGSNANPAPAGGTRRRFETRDPAAPSALPANPY